MPRTKNRKKLDEATRLSEISWKETSGVDTPANLEEGWVVMKSRQRRQDRAMRKADAGRKLVHEQTAKQEADAVRKADLISSISSAAIGVISNLLGVNRNMIPKNYPGAPTKLPEGTKPGAKFKKPKTQEAFPSKAVPVAKPRDKSKEPPHKSGTSTKKPKARSTATRKSVNRFRRRGWEHVDPVIYDEYWEWNESDSRGSVSGRIQQKGTQWLLELRVDPKDRHYELFEAWYKSLDEAKSEASEIAEASLSDDWEDYYGADAFEDVRTRK